MSETRKRSVRLSLAERLDRLRRDCALLGVDFGPTEKVIEKRVQALERQVDEKRRRCLGD